MFRLASSPGSMSVTSSNARERPSDKSECRHVRWLRCRRANSGSAWGQADLLRSLVGLLVRRRWDWAPVARMRVTRPTMAATRRELGILKTTQRRGNSKALRDRKLLQGNVDLVPGHDRGLGRFDETVGVELTLAR